VIAALLVFFALAGAPSARAVSGPERAPARVDALMASTVCVIGEVAHGKFEASGFVVEPGDQVMTTAHEISSVTNLRVKTKDGRVFPARLDRVGTERADVAQLTLVGGKLPAAALGSVDRVAAGDSVVTIGCPGGFEFSVTRGVVSGIRDSGYGYPLVQTDVAVNPGSSGGPLFDASGRVVGIVKSAVVARDRIHFALPIDLGTALLEQVAHERQAYQLFNEAVLEARLDEKAALYRKAIALQPDLAEAHYNLAFALERLGKKEDAATEYREALRLRPGDVPATLNLGSILYEDQALDEAAAVYRAALALRPGSLAVRNNLAQTYAAQGRSAEARREFEAILRADPGYANAHFNLAVLLDDGMHQPKLAAEHYRRYLALAPDGEDAPKARASLEKTEPPNR
jgi:hypothetical protein